MRLTHHGRRGRACFQDICLIRLSWKHLYVLLNPLRGSYTYAVCQVARRWLKASSALWLDHIPGSQQSIPQEQEPTTYWNPRTTAPWTLCVSTVSVTMIIAHEKYELKTFATATISSPWTTPIFETSKESSRDLTRQVKR